MEFLILWLGTNIISFWMEMVNELRMFKDAADAGYKIDMARMSDLSKQLNPNASKVALLSMLIPIFNIMQGFQRANQYNNVKSMMLDQLNVLDILEEMSEIEKQEYLKKPTALNALFVPLKMEIRLAKASSIGIKHGDQTGKIFYEMGDSLDDIIILKTTGYASRLTVEEQKKEVINATQDIVSKVMEMVEYILKEYSNNANLDLKHNLKAENKKLVKTTQEPSVSEQKQELGNFKNKLIDEQQAMLKSDIENGPTLINKRK